MSKTVDTNTVVDVLRDLDDEAPPALEVAERIAEETDTDMAEAQECVYDAVDQGVIERHGDASGDLRLVDDEANTERESVVEPCSTPDEGRVNVSETSKTDPQESSKTQDCSGNEPETSDTETWGEIEQAMADRAAYAARLLAEEMPPDIEEVFEACGISLFPDSYRDMRTNCTCPDSANPCKHIAAVFYILAEQFDEDPFLIFRWRRRTRELLLDNLQALRGVADDSDTDSPVFEKGDERPLGECMDDFWMAGESLSDVQIRSETTEVSDATLQRLGEPPAALTDSHDVLAEYYAEMTESNGHTG